MFYCRAEREGKFFISNNEIALRIFENLENVHKLNGPNLILKDDIICRTQY